MVPSSITFYTNHLNFTIVNKKIIKTVIKISFVTSTLGIHLEQTRLLKHNFITHYMIYKTLI